jgi:predicted O-methyltransferase YrrM
VPVLQADSADYILDLVSDTKVKRLLEIGTAIGRTAILAAQANPGLQVVTIERDPEMIEQAKINIANSDAAERITLIAEDALTCELPQGEFDCIFIDAAKSQYTRFFKKFSPLLSENGLIITDNMDFHGLVEHPERTHNRHTKGLIRRLKAYRSFLQEHPDFETRIVEIGDGIAISRRRKHV